MKEKKVAFQVKVVSGVRLGISKKYEAPTMDDAVGYVSQKLESAGIKHSVSVDDSKAIFSDTTGYKLAQVSQVRKRAARGSGRLYKRGADGKEYRADSAKAGVYWLEYRDTRIKDKAEQRQRVRLEKDGDPITTIDDARYAQGLILEPIRLAKKTDQLKRVESDLRDTESKLDEANKSANRTLVSDVWNKFPYEYKSRGKSRVKVKLSESTIKDNRSLWNKFVKWCPVKYIEDITEDLGKQYSRYILDELQLSGNRHNKLIHIASVMVRTATGENPLSEIRLEDTEPHSHDEIPAEIAVKAYELAHGHEKRLLAALMCTALRLKDVVTLVWDDDTGVCIDLSNVARKTGKSGKWVRFRIIEPMRAELDKVPLNMRTGYVFPELNPSEYESSKSAISRKITSLLEMAQNELNKKSPDKYNGRYTAHGYRVLLATVCARAGVPINEIMAWLAHSSELVTEIYNRCSEIDTEGRIAGALSNAFQLPEVAEVEIPVENKANETVPDWIVEQLNLMTAKNWKEVRDQILTN